MFELEIEDSDTSPHGKWHNRIFGKNIPIEVPVMTSTENNNKYSISIGEAYLLFDGCIILIEMIPITPSVKHILVIGNNIETNTKYYITKDNKWVGERGRKLDCYLVFESAKDCAEYRLRH